MFCANCGLFRRWRFRGRFRGAAWGACSYSCFRRRWFRLLKWRLRGANGGVSE